MGAGPGPQSKLGICARLSGGEAEGKGKPEAREGSHCGRPGSVEVTCSQVAGTWVACERTSQKMLLIKSYKETPVWGECFFGEAA